MKTLLVVLGWCSLPVSSTQTTLYTISNDGVLCSQVSLDDGLEGYAGQLGDSMSDGECAQQGYTRSAGQETIHDPDLGDINVVFYSNQQHGSSLSSTHEINLTFGRNGSPKHHKKKTDAATTVTGDCSINSSSGGRQIPVFRVGEEGRCYQSEIPECLKKKLEERGNSVETGSCVEANRKYKEADKRPITHEADLFTGVMTVKVFELPGGSSSSASKTSKRQRNETFMVSSSREGLSTVV